MKFLWQFASVLGFFMAFIGEVPAQHHHYQAPRYSESWSKPDPYPDHIVLNLTEDLSTSMSVSWRTDTTVRHGMAEIAIATPAPKFWRSSARVC
jgi:hypothetical protein